MQPIRSRDQLTALVAQHAPTNACARALSENRATVLGGFTPAGGLPCYIVQVTSKHNKTWTFKVECDEVARCYWVREIDQVPWRWWAGDSRGNRPLIDGDEPIQAAFERMKERRRDSLTP